MSKTAINAAYRRLGYPSEVIEHQLPHKMPDTLRQSYNWTRFLAQRHQLMQAWVEYLDRLKTDTEMVEVPAARKGRDAN